MPGVQPTRIRTIAFKTRPDRRCVQVNAFFKSGEKQASEEEEMFTGFRYDPSMQVCMCMEKMHVLHSTMRVRQRSSTFASLLSAHRLTL